VSNQARTTSQYWVEIRPDLGDIGTIRTVDSSAFKNIIDKNADIGDGCVIEGPSRNPDVIAGNRCVRGGCVNGYLS
jgi:hypothetical protein